MSFRKIKDIAFSVVVRLGALIVIGSLAAILGTILWKGVPTLSWEMISKTPKGGYYLGGGGGILNAIIGSLILAFGATVLSLFLSIPIILFMHIYAKRNSRYLNFVRYCLDVMLAIPSIIYGAFGFLIMLFFGLKVSLLAGIITVTLLLLPIMVRGIDEVLKTTPLELYEAAFSLGSTRWEAGTKVILKYAYSGFLTVSLISFGRAMGDAASVLFTTGFTDRIPTSLTEPAATLPLAIFFQLSSPFESVRDRAYASAVVLTIIILIISLLSRYIAKRYTKHSI